MSISGIEHIGLRKAFLNRPPFIHVLHGMMHRRSLSVHRHDFSEIVIVLGGQAVHLEDSAEYPLQPGDVFTVLGDTSHGYRDTRKFEICNIAFRPGVLAPYAGLLGRLPGYGALFRFDARSRRQKGIREYFRLKPEELGPISDLLRRMEKEWMTKRPGYEALVTGFFLQLVVELSRASSGWGEKQAVGQNPGVASTIDFMETHYADRIALADLAARANMSANTLIRVFKQATDMTPIDYLIHLRIRKACERAADTSRPLKEIAFDVGFSDSNYFARQFRKIMGMTASQYRGTRDRARRRQGTAETPPPADR